MKTLKIVPQYDGHENISVWLERFMECAETLREDKRAMLPLALSGEAAIVFRGLGEAIRADFDKSAAALREAFAPSRRLPRASFAS